MDSLESPPFIESDSVVAEEEEESRVVAGSKKRTVQSVDAELTDLLSTLDTTQTRLKELETELKNLENTVLVFVGFEGLRVWFLCRLRNKMGRFRIADRLLGKLKFESKQSCKQLRQQ